MKNDFQLNRRQRKAAAAFIEQPSKEAAAAAAGVTIQTIERWFEADPDFAAAVQEARTIAVDRAVTRLANAAVDAADCLSHDPAVSPTVRIQTAASLLSALEVLRP